MKSVISSGMIVCASFIVVASHSAYASGSSIDGNVKATQHGYVKNIKAKQGAEVHLGAFKLQKSNIKGDVNVTGRAIVDGKVIADKNSLINVAGVMIKDTTVAGNLKTTLYANTKDITAGKDAQVHVAGINLEKSQFAKNLTVKSEAFVKGKINADDRALVNVASLQGNKLQVNGGDANIVLYGNTQDIKADKDSKVFISGAKLDNVTFNKGLKIKSISTIGDVDVEKGAELKVASAVLKNHKFNGSFDLNMSARVPGGITAEKGSTVELGSFSVE